MASHRAATNQRPSGEARVPTVCCLYGPYPPGPKPPRATTLLAEIPWERRTTEMCGKDVPVHRMEVWVADHPYTYSRRTYQPTPWTPTLVKLRAEIEATIQTNFNSVLLNRYGPGAIR